MSSTTSTPSASATSPVAKARRRLWMIAGIVVAWFVAAEAVSYVWYSSHESVLPKNHLPATGAEILAKLQRSVTEEGARSQEQEIGDAAMDILKCSYGRTLIWVSQNGVPAAVTAIRWEERSVVGGLETMHNPGNCLQAAGWTIGKKTEFGVEDYCGASCEVTQWEVTQGEQAMLAYSAVFRRFSMPVDATGGKEKSPSWNESRLRSVYQGRRDAPVLILLAYFPKGAFEEKKSGHARFTEAMRAIFCSSGQPAKTL